MFVLYSYEKKMFSPHESPRKPKGGKLTNEKSLSPPEKQGTQKPSQYNTKTSEGAEETYYSRFLYYLDNIYFSCGRFVHYFVLTVFFVLFSASLIERAGILNQTHPQRNQNIHPLLVGEMIHLRSCSFIMKKNSLLYLNTIVMMIILIGARKAGR